MKPLVVIAGAGQTGRELAARLSENWRVVLIDKEQRKLDKATKEVPLALVHKADATSYLVLRDAGMVNAQVAIGLTGRDEVNLEFCKLAIGRFDITNCCSVVTNRNFLERFSDLGVQVIGRAFAVSSVIQSRIDQGRRTTSELGLGAGELMEVTILAHSPVIGRQLQSFQAQAWLAGAIYRKERLVVPHGDTTFEKGDRVLLVGEPSVLPAVASFFRSGKSEFPLQYGSHLLVSDPEQKREGFSISEALYLAKATYAQSLKVLCAPYQDDETVESLCQFAGVPNSIRTAPEDWPLGVDKILTKEDCGCLILPAPEVGLLDWMGLGHNALFSLLGNVQKPCLLARGTFPYKRVLLVVSSDRSYSKATELAMDVTRLFKGTLTALAVLPPEFVSGSGHQEELKSGLEHAAQVGSYYSLEVETELLHGHPVHKVIEKSGDFDLVVMGLPHTGVRRWLSLDAAQHILLRTHCSTLVLPSD
jgi:trk/ktr system potassium uptake protein